MNNPTITFTLGKWERIVTLSQYSDYERIDWLICDKYFSVGCRIYSNEKDSFTFNIYFPEFMKYKNTEEITLKNKSLDQVKEYVIDYINESIKDFVNQY